MNTIIIDNVQQGLNLAFALARLGCLFSVLANFNGIVCSAKSACDIGLHGDLCQVSALIIEKAMRIPRPSDSLHHYTTKSWLLS